MAEHIDAFDADRLVLTHMGPTMLARVDDVEQSMAADGLVLAI